MNTKLAGNQTTTKTSGLQTKLCLPLVVSASCVREQHCSVNTFGLAESSIKPATKRCLFSKSRQMLELFLSLTFLRHGASKPRAPIVGETIKVNFFTKKWCLTANEIKCSFVVSKKEVINQRSTSQGRVFWQSRGKQWSTLFLSQSIVIFKKSDR